MTRIPLGLALLSICASNCVQKESPSAESANTNDGRLKGILESPNAVEYEVIHEAPSSQRSTSLCELLSHYDAGAGLYDVTRIIGVPEPEGPFTYLQLELLEAWSDNAPGAPIVRMSGGPSASGKETSGGAVSARMGEDMGALLYEPTAENKDFYGLFSLADFHDVGDGYTNGQLFAMNRVSAAILGAAVRSAFEKAGTDACPDILPDSEDVPSLADQGDMAGPEVEGADDPDE